MTKDLETKSYKKYEEPLKKFFKNYKKILSKIVRIFWEIKENFKKNL